METTYNYYKVIYKVTNNYSKKLYYSSSKVSTSVFEDRRQKHRTDVTEYRPQRHTIGLYLDSVRFN